MNLFYDILLLVSRLYRSSVFYWSIRWSKIIFLPFCIFHVDLYSYLGIHFLTKKQVRICCSAMIFFFFSVWGIMTLVENTGLTENGMFFLGVFCSPPWIVGFCVFYVAHMLTELMQALARSFGTEIDRVLCSKTW